MGKGNGRWRPQNLIYSSAQLLQKLAEKMLWGKSESGIWKICQTNMKSSVA
jgi:hypothetical protein